MPRWDQTYEWFAREKSVENKEAGEGEESTPTVMQVWHLRKEMGWGTTGQEEARTSVQLRDSLSRSDGELQSKGHPLGKPHVRPGEPCSTIQSLAGRSLGRIWPQDEGEWGRESPRGATAGGVTCPCPSQQVFWKAELKNVALRLLH